jgi:hypothetical protein
LNIVQSKEPLLKEISYLTDERPVVDAVARLRCRRFRHQRRLVKLVREIHVVDIALLSA